MMFRRLRISVISSLQMLTRDPITIIVYLAFLFSISFNLTIFVLVLFPLAGLLIGRIGARSFAEPPSRDNSDWVS